MKPIKTVYVKDYKRNLSNVVSEPEDGYVEYPIYKLSMELLSFDEDMIQFWHPLAKIKEIDMKGRIFFTIDNLEFEVRNDREDERVIVVSTNYQTREYNKYTNVNNLNLFKEFQHSFMLQDFVDSVNGYENVDDNGIHFTIDDVYYSANYNLSIYNMHNADNVIHFKIQSDEFGSFFINFKEVNNGYEYIGIAYDDVEKWYTRDDTIDLDYEIEKLQSKRDLVNFIKFKLYDIFGVGNNSK